MNCKHCGNTLNIGKAYITFEGDNSPETPTKAFNNLPMICTNPQCSFYGGDKQNLSAPIDLDNPKLIVEVLKQALN